MKTVSLQHHACAIRELALRSTTQAGAGHPTSVLSCADILAVLFFHTMRFDRLNPLSAESDHFILSKGHAAPGLYAVWQQLGWITQQDIMGLRTVGSPLEGHPTYRSRFAEVATGSLGMGLSMAVGMTEYARIFKQSYRTFVVLGDSELAEGSNWEAFDWAGTQQLNNLVAIIDINALGQQGATQHGYDLAAIAARVRACSWQVLEVDGHDINALVKLFDSLEYLSGPICILAQTVKGFGITSVEGRNNFHGKAFSHQELPALIGEIHDRFACPSAINDNLIAAEPQRPQLPEVSYDLLAAEHFEKIAPRKAFGLALARAGEQQSQLLVFDAEVSNSTYTNLFAQQFPHRFIEAYIAEQNMVGMAIGTNVRGAYTVVSTFAAFFTRAYDQIRMSVLSATSIVFAGTHVGCSIGSDGPSQMGLEDIALFRSLDGSIVLYPADGVSAARLLEICCSYRDGNSYLRLTRAELPNLYQRTTIFNIGGSHLLRSHRNDQVLIVAAGITVHEALQAAEQLAGQGIFVAVLDLYSIKPLDTITLQRELARCHNRLIVVEDHYQAGGIGEAIAYALQGATYAVRNLCVKTLPRSGSLQDLLALYGIDAQAITRAVYDLTAAGK